MLSCPPPYPDPDLVTSPMSKEKKKNLDPPILASISKLVGGVWEIACHVGKLEVVSCAPKDKWLVCLDCFQKQQNGTSQLSCICQLFSTVQTIRTGAAPSKDEQRREQEKDPNFVSVRILKLNLSYYISMYKQRQQTTVLSTVEAALYHITWSM